MIKILTTLGVVLVLTGCSNTTSTEEAMDVANSAESITMQLQSELNDLGSLVSELQLEVSDLTYSISDLQSRVDDLDSKNSDLEKELKWQDSVIKVLMGAIKDVAANQEYSKNLMYYNSTNRKRESIE